MPTSKTDLRIFPQCERVHRAANRAYAVGPLPLNRLAAKEAAVTTARTTNKTKRTMSLCTNISSVCKAAAVRHRSANTPVIDRSEANTPEKRHQIPTYARLDNNNKTVEALHCLTATTAERSPKTRPPGTDPKHENEPQRKTRGHISPLKRPNAI